MPDKNTSNIVKLPADAVRKLKEAQPDIRKAKEALDAFRQLGMDTKEIEEKLAWTEKATETLLKTFS